LYINENIIIIIIIKGVYAMLREHRPLICKTNYDVS